MNGQVFRRIALLGLAAFFLLSCLSCSSPIGQVKQGVDETFLDRSVDPCTDFYQFACGTWIREHVPPAGYAERRFSEAGDRETILLRKILSDASKNTTSPDADTGLLGSFYNSCISSRTQSVMTAVLDDEIGFIRAAKDPATLAVAVATLHMNGVNALFNFGTDVDPGMPSRYVATFAPGGTSLDRDYYLDPGLSLEAAYKDHIQRMAALYDPPLTLDAEAIWSIESTLAAASPTDADARDPVATYNLTDTSAVLAADPSFAWGRYLDSAGMTGAAQINVTSPSYLARIEALLAALSTADLQTELVWRTLESHAQALGQSFIVEEARFHWGVLFGQPQPAPDWYACLQAAQSSLGFALSKPFVAYLFDDHRRQEASGMIETIRQALRTDVAGLAWLDDATRAEALAKLAEVAPKIGYPDQWPSYDGYPQDSYSYLYLQKAIANKVWQAAADRLTRSVNRDAWSFPPSINDAYYSPWLNEIVFPAAILQYPFFDEGQAAAVNYGAIGAVMGHELTHGFDDEGRHFDGTGLLRDWWTDPVAQEFGTRSSCIADQYSAYEPIAGSYIDGRVTLGENIADLGGLRLAYDAYESLGLDEQLADFSPEQQLFLAFAQIWCANVPDAQIQNQLETDTHSPPEFRVNGVVRNLPEFAAAFHCPAGAPLAPSDRCELW